MDKPLRPKLGESDSMIEREHSQFSNELHALYGQSFPAKLACESLRVGFSEYLQPLAQVLPKSGAALAKNLDQAYLIELSSKQDIGPNPIAIFPIIPTQKGYCGFCVYDGIGPFAMSDEEYRDEFEKRVVRLPEFLQHLLRYYEQISYNHVGDCYLLPDVTILEKITYASSSIRNRVERKRRKGLTAQFGNLENILVLASGSEENEWTIFFDNSQNGDGSIFWAADSSFDEPRKFNDPQLAFDLLFEHLILGMDGEFDFLPHTVRLS